MIALGASTMDAVYSLAAAFASSGIVIALATRKGRVG
jgi:hypothetical protein